LRAEGGVGFHDDSGKLTTVCEPASDGRQRGGWGHGQSLVGVGDSIVIRIAGGDFGGAGECEGGVVACAALGAG